MNIFVITTKTTVYTTSYKSIVYKEKYKNEFDLPDIQSAAYSIAFCYADCGCKVHCERVHFLDLDMTDADIFDYLEKTA